MNVYCLKENLKFIFGWRVECQGVVNERLTSNGFEVSQWFLNCLTTLISTPNESSSNRIFLIFSYHTEVHTHLERNLFPSIFSHASIYSCLYCLSFTCDVMPAFLCVFSNKMCNKRKVYQFFIAAAF